MAAFERCPRCVEMREFVLAHQSEETGESRLILEAELPTGFCVAHSLPRVTIEQMLDITPHPNAHSLDVAMVGQHRVVTGRHYKEGQCGYFIPQGAVVPDLLAEEMELLGLLDGPNRNVVKSRKMRGILSEGLFYGFGFGGAYDKSGTAWELGQDVTAELGVTFATL